MHQTAFVFFKQNFYLKNDFFNVQAEITDVSSFWSQKAKEMYPPLNVSLLAKTVLDYIDLKLEMTGYYLKSTGKLFGQ